MRRAYVETTVRALRSGEYRQARGMLGYSKTLCCIGVAAVANGMDQDTPPWNTGSAALYLGMDPDEMQVWIRWNDEEGKSFDQIARLIEEKYKEELP